MGYTERERARTHNYQQQQPRTHEYQGAPYPHRQSFHHANTSLGALGHVLHMSMVAAPLVIGEMIQDSEQKWKAMRMVPVLGAIASEALWTLKISHDRKREREDHAALEACQQQYR